MKYFIFIFLVLAFYACQNEVDKFVPEVFIGPGDYHDALLLIQNAGERYEVDAEERVSLINGNTVVEIPSDAFVHANNERVAGQIEILITILNRQKDFVKYDLPTINQSGDILEAVVFVQLEAKQNELDLKLNPSADPIVITSFSDNPLESQVYENMIANNEIAHWVENGSILKIGEVSVGINGTTFDSTGYQFDLTILDWLGVQRITNFSNFGTLCLDLLDSNTPKNTRAYLLHDELNTCLRLNISNVVDCAETIVPIGEAGIIAIFAHKGELNGMDHIEIGSQQFLMTASEKNVEIQPILVRKEELVAFVEDL